MRKIEPLVMLVIVMLLAAMAAPLALATANGAGSSVDRALDYLRSRQQSDGGFAEPGGKSSEQVTSWVICAVASAGKNPASWRMSGKSPVDFLSARAGGWSKLPDIERNCLAVCSAGADPRSFGGRNLVADIKARIATDGHIGDMVNDHCWGIIALVAAGEKAPDSSRTWLAARQNIDGGFGFSGDSGSDPDDTGAALQALAAAGEDRQSNTIKRALSYLRFCQASDGGFTWQAGASNTGSTAWCVQGLVAAGEDAGADAWAVSGKTPLDFLSSMQKDDGHFRYAVDTDTNPVWMTAESVPAVLKKQFPLNMSNTPKKDAPAAATNSSASANFTVATDNGAIPAIPANTNDADTTPSRANPPSAKHRLARDADLLSGWAVSDREPGGGVAAFLVICATYLLALGLVYLANEVISG
ncbi:MAG: hypothetical protein CVT63_04870 [Candidatus Anoxymicrobium japonicum]|uniref:Prenyltransferase alpha-alpha toroid domain-containing protein n=1 Tax=Candidatus Anoxymicrobium japonicum TaxID=2013648 RepID=A0A2N3G5Q9_9ACTN|nr:MAG: hypothetical protein CVT63_04870 [Candidatus Anoxymicrobium japonicum]